MLKVAAPATAMAAVMVAVMAAGLLLAGGADGREPVLHRVGGGKFTWAPNINFTNWSIHEHFYVGDWLYFGFDKHLYNVLEVNKTSYEICNEKDFMKNISRGAGRDVFNLTEAKPFYFLSGGGFCFQGMKLAVFVEDYHQISPNLTASNVPKIANFSPSLSSSKNLPGFLFIFAIINALARSDLSLTVF